MKPGIPFLIVFLVVTGCTHPLEIVGSGDIRSDSGDNDCLLEDLPCKAVAVTEYVETYRPNPRSGYQFVGWENCLTTDGEACVFNIPSQFVVPNWFTTWPALVAKFAPLCEGAPADSFASIQNVIFNGKGCSSSNCHGASKPAAGMSLSNGNSFAAIIRVTASSGGGLKRILPGDADASYLYRKVSAKTNPGSFVVSGSPMPLVGSALSNNQLAALAAWIDAGAPQTGRADEFNEVERLLGLCD